MKMGLARQRWPWALRARLVERIGGGSEDDLQLQRLSIRQTVLQRIIIESQIVVYLLMVLGLGIPDDAGCRDKIPVCGSVCPLDATMPGCRASIPSKGKQRFGALFSVERSIELTTAVRHPSPGQEGYSVSERRWVTPVMRRHDKGIQNV